MIETIATDNVTAVLGIGKTGLSCARYLHSRQRSFAAFDSAMNDAAAEDFRSEFPQVPLYIGEFEAGALQKYSVLMVSPGISLADPAIDQALQQGAILLSDIDVLVQEVEAPIIAITGSNGKTTVTTLLGLMAESSGLRVAVGGNIGTPALDLLEQDYQLYVLELSSFQLERSGALAAKAATVLNVSPDHMDRYDSLFAYQQSKQRIYRECACVVLNRGDKLTSPMMAQGQASISFGLDRPDLKQYGIVETDGQSYLARGREVLLPVQELRIHGEHNWLNALAALALGEAAGLDLDAMIGVLREFPGLPHRCQFLGELQGVSFYNDSKGTNTGATIAAVSGLSRRATDIVLIAGGVGKGADFSALLSIAKHLRGLVVIGESAADIVEVMKSSVPVEYADDMAAALAQSVVMAESGDSVLLSPSCASFDMYRSYEERGDDFAQLVAQHLGGETL